jgi:ABC-2 type transport system ATP-binding protein
VSAPLLLELDGVRIDRGGAPLLEGLSLGADADRVALIGDWSGLFQLLATSAELVAGQARIAGRPAESAAREQVIGLALVDPPLPPAVTALAYLEQSARLLGLQRAAAKAAARAALERLGVGSLAGQRLADLPRAHRRVVLIAHATLGSPQVLVLEAPLAELDDWNAGWVLEILWRAAADHRLLVSSRYAPALGRERELIDRMDQVIVLESGVVVAQGPAASALAGSRRYRVVASRHADALAKRLVDQQLSVHVADGAPGAARLIVELPEGTAPDAVLDAALEVDAPVLELLPLDGRS